MAALRRCVARLGINLTSRATTKTCPSSRLIASVASYSRDPPEKPVPFNYRTTNFAKDKTRLPYSHFRYDEYTAWRFDENSRVISVEGPIASGKHEFAKELAAQLGFLYVPQCPVENLWYNEYYDFYETEMDEILEPDERIYTPASWHADTAPRPEDQGGYQGRVGGLQIDYWRTRMNTYADALLHLFSTGQGIVTVRTPWSDLVFATALKDTGYLIPEAWDYYNRMHRNSSNEYPRPHVTIYIENDTDSVLQAVKKRNRGGEATSGKISRDFVDSMEDTYQKLVLPKMKENTDCIMYPRLEKFTPHDISLVVEDIEALGSLEPAMAYDEEYQNDWLELWPEQYAADFRKNLDDMDYRHKLVDGHALPHEAPGMVMSVEDIRSRNEVLREFPGFRYANGYDPALDGMEGALFGPKKLKDLRKFYVPRSELLEDGSEVQMHANRMLQI